MNFPETELLRTKPKIKRSRKRNLSSSVYLLKKTSHTGISLCSRAGKAKKCAKSLLHVQSCCFADQTERWFAVTWWDGHVGGQNNSKLWLVFCIIIESNSQKTFSLLFCPPTWPRWRQVKTIYCSFDVLDLVAIIVVKAPYSLSMFQALRNWGRRKVKRKALNFAPISTIWTPETS